MWIDVGVGALVGLIIGASGIGGGAIMTPILLSGYGLPLSVAIGTDLVFATCTKLATIVGYARKDSVDWRVVGQLAAGSLPAALLIVALWPEDTAWFEHIARQVLGGMLVLTACFLVLRPFIARAGQMRETPTPLAFVALGAVIGVVVALTSIGAGVVGTVMLMLWLPKLPMARVIGTEVGHAVLLTGVAGIGHMTLGHVNWELVIPLIIGSIPGALIGVQLAHGRLANRLRPLLIGLISLAGLRLLAGA